MKLPSLIAVTVLLLTLSIHVESQTKDKNHSAEDEEATAAKARTSWSTASPPKREEASYISIYSLLGSPEKYEGKLLCLDGVILFDFEKQALYPDHESAEKRRFMNAIWLDLSRFDKESIEQISRIQYKDGVVLGRYRVASEAPYEWSSGTLQVERISIK